MMKHKEQIKVNPSCAWACSVCTEQCSYARTHTPSIKCHWYRNVNGCLRIYWYVQPYQISLIVYEIQINRSPRIHAHSHHTQAANMWHSVRKINSQNGFWYVSEMFCNVWKAITRWWHRIYVFLSKKTEIDREKSMERKQSGQKRKEKENEAHCAVQRV